MELLSLASPTTVSHKTVQAKDATNPILHVISSMAIFFFFLFFFFPIHFITKGWGYSPRNHCMYIGLRLAQS